MRANVCFGLRVQKHMDEMQASNFLSQIDLGDTVVATRQAMRQALLAQIPTCNIPEQMQSGSPGYKRVPNHPNVMIVAKFAMQPEL